VEIEVTSLNAITFRTIFHLHTAIQVEDGKAFVTLHNSIKVKRVNDFIVEANVANEAFARTQNTGHNVTFCKFDSVREQRHQFAIVDFFQISHSTHIDVFVQVKTGPQHFPKGCLDWTSSVGTRRQIGIHVSQLFSKLKYFFQIRRKVEQFSVEGFDINNRLDHHSVEE
jgi:hypothetical protein